MMDNFPFIALLEEKNKETDMSIIYNQDNTPEVPTEMINLAERLNLHLVNIICDEKQAKVGDTSGLSFIAMMPFLPRPGDQIILEDGHTYQVKQIYFKQTQREGQLTFLPNVYSLLLQE